MQFASPHYLLFSEAIVPADAAPRWRFVLQPIGGDDYLVADDAELDTPCNRLELLAVVRGLEALDQPSRVTLLTASRYVNRGIRRGLSQWRERNWRWERFGQLVPIRNRDLWQRIDQAMQFHQVECCIAPILGKNSANLESALLAFRGAVRSNSQAARSVASRRTGPLSRTLELLRQGVLAPLSAIWPPAFTRAA